jgi:hypothetical protein
MAFMVAALADRINLETRSPARAGRIAGLAVLA